MWLPRLRPREVSLMLTKAGADQRIRLGWGLGSLRVGGAGGRLIGWGWGSV